MYRYSNNNPLRRLGKKNILIPKLRQFAPENFDVLISLFYGTGALENSYIGKIKYIFANDFDNNVFNLYQILKHKPNELIEEIEMLPIGEASWQFFKEYKELNLTAVERALFFLYYSNFGYMGKPETFKYGLASSKKMLLKNIKNFLKKIVNNQKTEIVYLNNDFRDVFKKISFVNDREKSKVFIYADPPYFGKTNNYDTPEWQLSDFLDLVKILVNSGMKFMISEFNQHKIIKIAKENNLIITEIGERRNMVNRKTEIIITNYKVNNLQSKLTFAE